MADQPRPTLSIILEWETGGECGGGRAERCLAEINRQMWQELPRLGGPPELILVADDGAPGVTDAGLEWPGRFLVARPPARLDYYTKKNHGFSLSGGDIVLFADSDLAPEPGWLAAMLEPFTDKDRLVVVGRTHLETGSLYERAVALFWIFDTRCDEALVRPSRRLVSNNIAFRRGLFSALPFPDRPTYRGQCTELGLLLARFRIILHEATAARAAHPAPAGFAAFVRRAWHAGRDALYYDALAERRGVGAWARVWREDMGSVRRRIRERAPRIGAGMGTRAAALLLGLLYYSVKAFAYLTGPRGAEAKEHAAGAARNRA